LAYNNVLTFSGDAQGEALCKLYEYGNFHFCYYWETYSKPI